MNHFQQGDVLGLERLPALPKGAQKVPRKDGRLILAEGEVSGHSHAIVDEAATLYEHEGTLFLQVDAPVELVHEEHHTQTIPPGVWRLGRVRELDMLEGFTRQVAD